jgi:hypothetical protein
VSALELWASPMANFSFAGMQPAANFAQRLGMPSWQKSNLKLSDARPFFFHGLKS